MSREPENHSHPDRRDFLKTAGAAAAGALLLPQLEAVAEHSGHRRGGERRPRGLDGAAVRPHAGEARREPLHAEARPHARLRARVRRRCRRVRGTRSRALDLPRQRGARHERRAARRQLGERHRLPARPLRRPLHEHARAGVRRHGRRDLQAEARLHRARPRRVSGRARRGGAEADAPRGRQVRRRAATQRLAHRPGRARLAPRGRGERAARLHDRALDQSGAVRSRATLRCRGRPSIRRRSPTARRSSTSVSPIRSSPSPR